MRPLALARIGPAFLSTPSARRATGPGWIVLFEQHISIHALREEGDYGGTLNFRGYKLFLSTPSARRATFTAQGAA